MADNLGMAAHLAGQSLRLGWFFALNRLVEQRSAAASPGPGPPVKPSRPVPTLRTLLADVGQQVGGGKAIAIVGASGGHAESGLYFELRYRGQAIDAAKWLRTPP